MSFNNPALRDENNDSQVRRYVHSPLTIDHYGIQAAIQANGKIVLTSKPEKISGTDEVEFDTIEIPASLIFKLASLLKATRRIEYIGLEKPTAELAK